MLKHAAAWGLAAACLVAGGGAASAQTRPDLEYQPIAPCRAFDTRATAAVGAGQTRSFHISGSTDFPGQGGPAHGCGVPAYATAVSLTLISLSQAAAGYLTAFAYNSARPSAVSLYYQRNVTLANTVIASINQGAVSIFSSQQSHVAADVTGYYAPGIEGYVNGSGALISGTRVVSAAKSQTGFYTVTADRDLASCTVSAQPDNSSFSMGAIIGSNIANFSSRNITASGAPYGDTAFYFRINC
ncbi:MAG: hypothetical protein ABW275_01565 [Hansschlegelia sp.]